MDAIIIAYEDILYSNELVLDACSKYKVLFSNPEIFRKNSQSIEYKTFKTDDNVDVIKFCEENNISKLKTISSNKDTITYLCEYAIDFPVNYLDFINKIKANLDFILIPQSELISLSILSDHGYKIINLYKANNILETFMDVSKTHIMKLDTMVLDIIYEKEINRNKGLN